MGQSRPHTGFWRRWRLPLLLLAPVISIVLTALFAPAQASQQAQRVAGPVVRDEEVVLQTTRNGQPYTVSIVIALVDDGSGDYPAQAGAARANILARFPAATVLPEGSITVESVLSGFWWPAHTTTWHYNAASKPAGLFNEAATITASANAWNGVGGAAWSFTTGAPNSANTSACGSTSSGLDGVNTVGWAPQSGSILAVTCSWYQQSTGNLAVAVESDMQIDPDWNWTMTTSSVGIDLQSVITHEFGHMLGLGHTNVCPGSVMCPTYAAGTLMRIPQLDDANGVISIYGTGIVPTVTATATQVPTQIPTSTQTVAPTQTVTVVPTSTPTEEPTYVPPRNACGRFPCATGTATASATPPPTASPTATSTAPTPCTWRGCPFTTPSPTVSPTVTTTATATATPCIRRGCW